MNPLDRTRPTRAAPRRTRRRPGGVRGARAPVDYERRIRPDASLDDIDLELAASFLAETPGGGDGRTALDTLRYYGLVRGSEPDWEITNTALLLFARSPARHWNPGAGIRVMRVAGTARIPGRNSTTAMGYAGPPLATAIRDALKLARDRIRISEPLRHIFFRSVPEYPRAAWREVLLNAIVHRSYEGTPEIEVVFYDDRVEIASPGLPLEPLSPDGIRKGEVARKTRNPLLCRILEDAGLVAARGRGLTGAYGAMEESMLAEPELGHRNGHFLVTLRNAPAYSPAGPGWKRIVGKLKIDEDQRRILLACPDGFTRDDYCRLNGVGVTEARRRLKELLDGGIVEPVATGAGSPATYYLTADLDSRRWFLEDRVPKLREYFRGQSGLRNTDYRTLFNTSYAVARRELLSLAEDGFLRVVGQGRGQRYLPAIGLRD